MRRRLLASLALAVAGVAPADAQPVDGLIRAERAFAKDALERTVSDAFLAAFAEGGLVFRPDPVPVRTWMPEHPTPADRLLEWEPEFASVSRAGDLGYTTGPWSSGRKGTETRAGFGRFVTVWARRGGQWRALIDHGIAHPGPRPPVDAVATHVPSGPAAAPARTAEAADAALNHALAEGRQSALGDALAAEARVLRDGVPPAAGHDARRLAASGPSASEWRRAGGGVASSGDLAWAHGEWRADASRGHYLRVWRVQDGRWRLALDLTTAVQSGGG